jgi:hypothetical protein
MYGGKEMCVQGFAGETWGSETLGRSKHRLNDNIKIGLQGVGCEVMDRIELARDRDGDRWRTLVNVVMNLQVP